MSFKAAIFAGPHLPLEIEEVKPTPLGQYQVLVKIIVSGLCGAQLQELRGEKNPTLVPRLLGHEGCGRVLEIGPGVKTVKPGDLVVMHWRRGLGGESDFPTYLLGNKIISSGLITTFSEQSIVSENRLTAIPSHISPFYGALLGCGLSTALATVTLKANLKIGESVLVLGCGGVGLCLIGASRLAGAGKVVGLDIINKSSLVGEFGAEFSTDVEGKFDVIFDTTGNPQLIREHLNSLTCRGRFIMVGQPKNWSDLNIPSKQFFDGDGLSLCGTQGGGFIPNEHIPHYTSLPEESVNKLLRVISHNLPLEQINDGFTLLQSGSAGRIMITI